MKISLVIVLTLLITPATTQVPRHTLFDDFSYTDKAAMKHILMARRRTPASTRKGQKTMPVTVARAPGKRKTRRAVSTTRLPRKVAR